MQLRLRHSKGVSTVTVDDNDTIAVLQDKIAQLSDVPPPLQQFKVGYPPRSLTTIPDLPVSSLGLVKGDQLILTASAAQPPNTSLASSKPSAPTTTASSSASSKSSSNGPEHVATDAGFLLHRVVPDDNSCLFSSVALAFEQSMSKASHVREIVAKGIRADPIKYNEAILAATPEKYVSTILRPTTWGGAIELSVLVDHYSTQILSIDVETGRVDTFDPQTPSNQRCILLYSGIHYDTVSLAPSLDAPEEWHQTLFPVSPSSSDPILQAASQLATKLREKKAFTNTSTFDLKCQDCGIGLKGEKDARAHAQKTGHVRFGEY